MQVLRPERTAARLGVTLMELMIVLAILGIVAGAAVPIIADSMVNRRAHDAAREVAGVFKAQRYRAGNLNRAMGIVVSESSNDVKTYVSLDNTCSSLSAGTEKVALDVSARFVGDAKISTTNWVDTMICIKPNGQVGDASGTPFANGISTTDDLGGALLFEVGRTDDVGSNHVVKLPFNGVARLIK